MTPTRLLSPLDRPLDSAQNALVTVLGGFLQGLGSRWVCSRTGGHAIMGIASLQRAVEQQVAEIADPVVRDFYRNEMRSRLNRLRRPDPAPWQPGARKPFRRPGDPPPPPFAAGSAARRSGVDLEGAAFCRWLTTEIGVAAIPLSAFYSPGREAITRGRIRFAFCKQQVTLERAAERLQRLIA